MAKLTPVSGRTDQLIVTVSPSGSKVPVVSSVMVSSRLILSEFGDESRAITGGALLVLVMVN